MTNVHVFGALNSLEWVGCTGDGYSEEKSISNWIVPPIQALSSKMTDDDGDDDGDDDDIYIMVRCL